MKISAETLFRLVCDALLLDPATTDLAHVLRKVREGSEGFIALRNGERDLTKFLENHGQSPPWGTSLEDLIERLRYKFPKTSEGVAQ